LAALDDHRLADEVVDIAALEPDGVRIQHPFTHGRVEVGVG
jgi:hypothetical protein